MSMSTGPVTEDNFLVMVFNAKPSVVVVNLSTHGQLSTLGGISNAIHKRNLMLQFNSSSIPKWV